MARLPLVGIDGLWQQLALQSPCFGNSIIALPTGGSTITGSVLQWTDHTEVDSNVTRANSTTSDNLALILFWKLHARHGPNESPQ